MELLFLIIILSYLLGSIPSAVWVGKYFKGIDIREHGSKNAGATNTFRVLGKRYGWLVLLVDVAKGSIASCLPYFFASCWFAGYKDEFLILQLTAAFFAVFLAAMMDGMLVGFSSSQDANDEHKRPAR